MSILRIASSCRVIVAVLDMPSAYGSLRGVSMAEKAEPQAPARRDGVEGPGRRGENRELPNPYCNSPCAACPGRARTYCHGATVLVYPSMICCRRKQSMV